MSQEFENYELCVQNGSSFSFFYHIPKNIYIYCRFSDYNGLSLIIRERELQKLITTVNDILAFDLY